MTAIQREQNKISACNIAEFIKNKHHDSNDSLFDAVLDVGIYSYMRGVEVTRESLNAVQAATKNNSTDEVPS